MRTIGIGLLFCCDRTARARRLCRVALLGFLGTGCGTADAGSPPTPGQQYIIGVDISASRTDTQLDEAGKLAAGIVDRIEYGDRLVFIETYRAGTDAARQYADSVPSLKRAGRPTGGERKRLDRFRSSAQIIARGYLDKKRSKTILSTDLLTTLQRAADYAKSGQPRRTTVLLLSDMLNSTPELNMERAGGIPDSLWIEERRASGRMPDLGGVCVFAVGGDVQSPRSTATRRFWRQYLKASGANYSDANYRNMIADARELACP